MHSLFKVSSNKDYFLEYVGQNDVNGSGISKAIEVVEEYLKYFFNF